MKIFHKLNVKVIFLQNIVTDLLLGFGVKDVFIGFASHIKEKYGVERQWCYCISSSGLSNATADPHRLTRKF